MTWNAAPAAPKVVLALRERRECDSLELELRQRGWQVHVARSGPEARRLALQLDPRAVILDTELPEESGWLTCAKIALADSTQCVILVQLGGDVGRVERLGHAVGAVALVSQRSSILQKLEFLAEHGPDVVCCERET